MDVLYFSDTNVHCVIHRQAQVNQEILVGHTSQLHERYGVTVIKAAFIFIRLRKHRLLKRLLSKDYNGFFACIKCRFYLRDCKYAPEGPLLHRVKLRGPLRRQIIPVCQASIDSDDNTVFCRQGHESGHWRSGARAAWTYIIYIFGHLLTNLINHFERNVELQDNQDVLEPGAHLLVGERYVRSKNNVIGIQCFCQGLVETVDLLAPV